MDWTAEVNNNHSSDVLVDNYTYPCSVDIPTAAELLGKRLPKWARILLVFFAVCCVISLTVFIEEVIFLSKHFKPGARRNRTLWILAVFPVYTVSSFLAIIIPRSGVVVDLAANSFFASVLYQLVQLIISYLGGKDKMWTIIGETREISIRTPPVCCCCFCLPTVKLNRQTFSRLNNMVLQFTVIRPILFFIAAVLWTNKSYIPGNLLPNNGFLYISLLNLISTGVAMWSLLIMRGAFSAQLDRQYRLSGKVLCIQLTLLQTSVVNIICAALVLSNTITCNSLLSKKARGDELYHMVLTVLSCLFGLLARFFFRRESDSRAIISEEESNLGASLGESDHADLEHQTDRPTTPNTSRPTSPAQPATNGNASNV